MKLKRKAKVVSLASVSYSMKIKDNEITIDLLTPFQRICIIKQIVEIRASTLPDVSLHRETYAQGQKEKSLKDISASTTCAV